MASQIALVMSSLRSAFARTGIFAAVMGVEPSNTPGAGLTAAIFFTRARPAELSLIGATSVYVYTMRIYTDQLSSPTDKIEELIVGAVDKVYDVLADNFDIGGTIREIDFLGQFGEPVTAASGYIPVAGNPDSRIVDIIIPLVVNDTMDFS